MLKISSPISRRSALQSLALAATASSLPFSLFSQPSEASPPPDITTFLSLSSLLTGIKLDASYLQLGQDILLLLGLNYQFNLYYKNLLLSFENVQGQDQIKAKSLATIHPYPVQSIIKAWYLSQVSLTEKDRNLPLVQRLCPNLREQGYTSNKKLNANHTPIIGQINYDEALTWQACHFTKPSATCGGPFGYWANLPKTV